MNRSVWLFFTMVGLILGGCQFEEHGQLGSEQGTMAHDGQPETRLEDTTARLHSDSVEAWRVKQPTTDGLLKEEAVVEKSSRHIAYRMSYMSDGLKVYTLMLVPNGSAPEGGWPVVIVNHGHIPPKLYSTERSYINTSRYFAGQGFLVLKPDYRGHDRSEGVSDGIASRFGYAEDVINLMTTIPSVKMANDKKIFMYGHSMGGDVTLRVLETTSKVTAATIWAPAVWDFPEQVLYFSRRSPERQAALKAELDANFSPDDYHQVETLSHLLYLQVPINLHHATADESVPYTWGVRLAEELKKVEKTVYFYTYEGDNHDIAGHWGQALQRDVTLFRQFL